MFDIGFSEIFLIALVAIIAIGPEDLPDALFRLGRMIRQVKLFLNNIQNQYSEIMHEAEVAHYRKKLDQGVMTESDSKKITNDVPTETVHDTAPQPSDHQ